MARSDLSGRNKAKILHRSPNRGQAEFNPRLRLKIKPAVEVLHDFIDAVSKNGHLLLNVSPKADGTIPQDQRDCLLAIGAWLKMNGEAIYGTRPWLEYGEGPNVLQKQGSFSGTVAYGEKDLRYTRSKDGSILYVTALGWPKNGLRPTILQIDDAAQGKVELLGHRGTLAHRLDGKRIIIDVPGRPASEHAHVFKLTGFKASLTPEAAKAREAALKDLSSWSPAVAPQKKAGKGKKK